MSKLATFLLTLAALAACQPETPAQIEPDRTTPQAAPAPEEPLNLSREVLQEIDTGAAQMGEDKALLPDMFEDQKAEKKVKLSGNILTDEEATQLNERIEGAEVKVEIKTK